MQDRALGKQLPVAYIREADENEVRDLFVRLQSGFPLNAQEKRDSLPGAFTDLILKLGGKPALQGYPGHSLFTNLLKMKPDTDRGKTRQLAAQIAILFLGRRQYGPDHFRDLKSGAIDDYYYTQLDFDASTPDCLRLREVLDKSYQLLSAWKGPKLVGHNAIHLILLVDELLDDYTHAWEGALLTAQESFSALHAESSSRSRNGDLVGEWQEAWQEYGMLTRSASDSEESIRRRHRYYTRKMMEFLDDHLVPKDAQRAFNYPERSVIYWRDGGICQKCKSGLKIEWSDSEIHHVVPYAHGGHTVMGNGVLVHKGCHPKTDEEVLNFARALKEQAHPGAKFVG